MAGQSHYKCNMRDIYFNLFEMNRLQDTVFGKAPFENMDLETSKELLEAIKGVILEKWSTTFAEGDKNPPKLNENGDVILSAGLKDALVTFLDNGYHLIDTPEKLGGIGGPKSLYWASFEMQSGANPPLGFYLFGSNTFEIFANEATEEQLNRFMKGMVEKHWMGTMCLTENNAGSDVGAARTKAIKQDDGTWHIEGVKQFITNGDFDAVENIIHMVLARPEGAVAGTRGLSLYAVPKFWVEEDGSMGERNGVKISNLEDKMGIKGSCTAELTFGEDKPARGFLVGEKHEGIRQMFLIIERARMAVGIKSMSTLSTAYLNALEYCKERVQGPDLKEALNKNAPRVEIIKHPDIRRMLMIQKSHAEALRGLVYHCSFLQDQIYIEQENKNSEAAEKLQKQVDILLPMIKGYSSERVYEILGMSLQCFGGAGYLKDHPMEQYIRDQKIDSLYEGTTHIQSLDLIFRKVAKDGGAALTGMTKEIHHTAKERKMGDKLKVEYDALEKALADNQVIMMTMMGKMGESIYHAGLQGNRILNALTEMFLGWQLVKQAELALEKMDSAHADDKNFYAGKVASAKFFCSNVLPNIALAKKLVENSSLDLMEIPEEVF